MAHHRIITPTLAVVAGHSAGHILPAHTIAHQWLSQNPNGKVLFFSTDKKLDTSLLSEKNNRIIHIPLALANPSFKQWWRIPTWSIKLIQACIQSYRILACHNTTKLITTGGSVAIPVCIAAKIRHIPIDLYELNVVPGKALVVLSFLAQTIYICFIQAKEHFKHKQCTIIPYPLQPALLKQQAKPEETRAALGLHPEYVTILILGGSQGSLFINNILKQWLPSASKQYLNIQIIHQTGSQDKTDWDSFYKNYTIPALHFTYHTAIQELYNAADIIICRAGAGTLFEIVHYKKKCITIPVEGLAGNHQVMNARAMAKHYPNLIQVLSQKEITVDSSLFFHAINRIILNSTPTTNQPFSPGQLSGTAPKP